MKLGTMIVVIPYYYKKFWGDIVIQRMKNATHEELALFTYRGRKSYRFIADVPWSTSVAVKRVPFVKRSMTLLGTFNFILKVLAIETETVKKLEIQFLVCLCMLYDYAKFY